MFARNCEKIGHKYEARFDSHFPNELQLERGSIAAIEALKTRTYVKDICVRCGKEIER